MRSSGKSQNRFASNNHGKSGKPFWLLLQNRMMTSVTERVSIAEESDGESRVERALISIPHDDESTHSADHCTDFWRLKSIISFQPKSFEKHV